MATYETPNFLGAVLGGGGKSSGGDDMQTVMQALTNAQNNAIAKEKLALEKELHGNELKNRETIAGIQERTSKYSADASERASKYASNIQQQVNQWVHQDNIDRRREALWAAEQVKKLSTDPKLFSSSELGLETNKFKKANPYLAGKWVKDKNGKDVWKDSEWFEGNKVPEWYTKMQGTHEGATIGADYDENRKHAWESQKKILNKEFGEDAVNKIINENQYYANMNNLITSEQNIFGTFNDDEEAGDKEMFKALNQIKRSLQKNKYKEVEEYNKGLNMYGTILSPREAYDVGMNNKNLSSEEYAMIQSKIDEAIKMQGMLKLVGNNLSKTGLSISQINEIMDVNPNWFDWLLNNRSIMKNPIMSSNKEETSKTTVYDKNDPYGYSQKK